jgi:hypothetical protein
MDYEAFKYLTFFDDGIYQSESENIYSKRGHIHTINYWVFFSLHGHGGASIGPLS